MEPEDFVTLILSSPFVDEALCREKLGGGRHDPGAARLYMQLPVRSRPQLSYLFDRDYYIEMNPDVADAGLDPFIHFLEHGCIERRSPNPFIDHWHIDTLDRYLLPKGSPVSALYELLRYDLVDPGPYFSIQYYRSQLTDAPATGLLEHFLREGLLHGHRPNPHFDPIWYYRQLDGVHDVWSGIRHFVRFGDGQGQAASVTFSGKHYLERHPDVAAAGVPPLAHYLSQGMTEGRALVPVSDSLTSLALMLKAGEDASAGTIDPAEASRAYNDLKEAIARRRQEEKDNVSVLPMEILRFDDAVGQIGHLSLPHFSAPRVSILVPAYNEANYTAECIGAILASDPQVSYEVIIADDASPDPAARALNRIRNVKFVQQSANVGFLRNCNIGFLSCRSEYILLLNNDAQLLPGALDYLVEVLDRNPDVAAVGPKMLYPNGRLQEAGCSVNRDGETSMVGLFANPAKPAFNYDRDVHYCSGAALLVRRSELGPELFDETFMPAYCEDVDLCLRLLSRGRRVVYCHRAEVVHHLSVSTNKLSVTKRLQLVARNQQKLARKWSGLLEDLNKVRTVAFYLPQYHPTPENDFYWGQGFTEWTNVTKARPAYVGHYQPHLPADLGFYDLRIKQTFEQQAALASRYGVGGFCVYYYNFGRHRTLDKAFESMVADPAIDFPYCVCWANENWTRHWDGGNREMIFEQKYDRVTLSHIIADATRYAADPRYIRVNDKPLFLVYRPLLIPDVRNFAELCRDGFREAGFNDVHLVYVESMEAASHQARPADLGFDACVEFPPQGLAVRQSEQTAGILRDDFIGVRYDYPATVVEAVSRPSVGYQRYPSVFPSWDNTARQPLRGDSFVEATPEAFQVYVEEKLDEVTRQFVGEERLVFVNAWNEWAEGTHLEPDRKHGHRWLEAIQNAVMAKSLS